MITTIHTALAAKRDQLNKDDKGFTLIELLVVVLIIGILAAIAIPVFLSQQNSAKDSAAKSDLANAKVSTISYQTENDGSYPASVAALTDFTKSDGVTSIEFVGTPSASGFCIQAESATGKDFKITDKTGAVEGTCSAGTTTAP